MAMNRWIIVTATVLALARAVANAQLDTAGNAAVVRFSTDLAKYAASSGAASLNCFCQ